MGCSQPGKGDHPQVSTGSRINMTREGAPPNEVPQTSVLLKPAAGLQECRLAVKPRCGEKDAFEKRTQHVGRCSI